MKGKIRVKIKHLIFIPIFIFVIFPNLLYFIGRVMFMNEKEYFYGNLVVKPYSYGIFELYTKLPKISFFDGNAYFYMGRLKYDYNVSVATNGGNEVTGNYNLDLGTYEEAVKLHEKGLEKSNGRDYSLNATALFNLYMERGEREKAEKIIEDSLKNESWKKNSAGKVLKIHLAIIDGDMEEAIKAYRETEKIVKNLKFEKFPLKISDYEGVYSKDRLNLGDKLYLANEKDFILELEDTMNINKIYSYNEIMGENSNLEGKNTIKGKITIEGKPVKYRPVIIGISKFNGFVYKDNLFHSQGEVVYTDEEGNYEIKNVPNMEYVNIVPLLTKEQALNNTVEYTVVKNVKGDKTYNCNLNYEKKLNIYTDEEFEAEGDSFDISFDKVEGADKYQVNLIFIEKFYSQSASFITTENKIKIPLLNGSFSTMVGFDEKRSGEEIFTENSFLGRYKKDTIDFINVMAIKEVDGEEIVMNSNIIKTKITSKEKALNEGEKLIQKGKVDEGIKWIEQKINEEGYKSEYIYPLIYITSNCGNYIKFENEEEKNKKINMVKESEKILLDKLYKINKNKYEIMYFKELYEYFYSYYKSN